MRLHEEIDVALVPTRVWEALADVDLVASCISGAELAPSEGADDGDYKGALTVRFGPKAIKFNGDVHYGRDDSDRVATITGRGQDPRSKTRVRTTLTVRVAPAPTDRETSLVVDGDMEIAGPLVSLIEAGAEHVARQLIDQFAASLRARLEEGTPAADEAEPAESAVPETTSGPTAKGINVMSFKMLVSIVWATIRRWLRIGRR